MTYRVFHGVAAVVVDVESETKFSVAAITSESDNGSKSAFDVDRQQTPAANPQNTNQWNFDDHMTIGTTECNSQGKRGTAYIEHGQYVDPVWHKAHIVEPWPPENYSLGACTSVVYSGENPPTRYHGFPVKVTQSATPGPLQVKFSPLGNSYTVTFGTDFLDPPFEARTSNDVITSGNPENWVLDATGILFVNSSFAKDTLQLEEPKVPIWLDTGGGGPSDPPVPAPPGAPLPKKPAPPSPQPVQRISISLAHPDDILNEVLDKIDGEARVVGVYSDDREPPTVYSVVEHRQKVGHPLGIDLIAHAAKGILQFAKWKIDSADQLCIKLRDEWKMRSPREIRLLGCSTAVSPSGRAALRHLKSVFGQVHSDIHVYGSTTALLATDFGQKGFLHDELLVEVEDLPVSAMEPSATDVVTEWFGRFAPVLKSSDSIRTSLTKETRSEAIARSIGPLIGPDDSTRGIIGRPRIDDLFSQLETTLFSAPGLLEVPDAERLYPAESGTGDTLYHRVSFFRGGAFVRVYSNEFPNGVLIRRRVAAP